MLSICVPIYNFDVNSLVESLQKQMSNLTVPCELILIDDRSENHFREINRSICQISSYIELDENIGRSRIRNLFLNYASNEYLLFLDGDSLINNDLFLENYIYYLKNKKFDVLVGGREYPKNCPSTGQKLSWKYGIIKESKSFFERSKHPNRAFMTNNFCIKRKLLEQIKFNEKLVGYGHEDTLFGIELEDKGYSIDHIHNPILNGDIETNENFLLKTEKAIENLVYIQKNIDSSTKLEHNVHLIRAYKELERKNLLFLVKFFYLLFKRSIRWSLKKGFVNLHLFDIYKLGFYISLRN
jgi:cellulose synthase/poly-beta-1,6-N-acetylglucosamine synthase-like glycosyltransferase